MLLMVEKGIRGGICQAMYRYAAANNTYIKSYDKDIECSYIIYLDINNLYGWEMSQKLPLDGFEWVENTSKFSKMFIKNYDENSDERYILEVDVECTKRLHNLHSDLPFLSEIMKIDECNNFVRSFYDKNNYVIHIRALKQVLNHGLILKKVHKVIQLNQKVW